MDFIFTLLDNMRWRLKVHIKSVWVFDDGNKVIALNIREP